MAAKKKTRRKHAAVRRGTGTGQSAVELRSDDTRVALETERLDHLAMQWSYVVRNRHRWADSPSEVERLSHQAWRDLEALGVAERELAALAACPVVEVGIDFESEQSSWSGRIFPWEFVLSRATRVLADRHPDFLVVRHLRTARAQRRGPRGHASLLFAASCPGAFFGEFDFEEERELLSRAVQGKRTDWGALRDPTRAELESRAREFDAVHLSGIDTHLGAELRGRHAGAGAGESASLDGMFLRGTRGREELVDAEALAALLNGAGHAHSLVTFNAYSSASRMASLVVAEGAGAAIGFQDRFDDAQTEQFYAVFYREWARGSSLLSAFRKAFTAMRMLKALRLGSGVVLWSGTSLLGQERGANAGEGSRMQSRTRDRRGVPRPSLKLVAKLPRSLNYPKLHNGENLFKLLRIYNYDDREVRGVQLEVVLQVGAESYAYRHRLDLAGPVTSLEHLVRIALSWNLMRGLSESVQTTVFIKATHDDHVFSEDTHPVELLPVNEWLDDNNSGPWLPSLVLPRDPVVAEVIDRARRYLRVLADDARAGFDGYQRLELTGEDVDDEQVWIVDVQVRAIWYALCHDYALGYINPPPTFTAESQRLRRPSEVLTGRHGTCIDLALLLAACMEYVGINPVLFLIDGHAFPGYWRIDRTLREIDVSGTLAREDVERMQAWAYPWSSGPQYWNELALRVRRGQIVPIETVDLTAAESFDLALEHGRENLRNPREFNTMLDVVKAREHRVTPLPL